MSALDYEFPQVVGVNRNHGGRLYFAVTAGKGGGEPAQVVVTDRGTFICLRRTCLNASNAHDCPHSRSASRYYAEHEAELLAGEPTPVALEEVSG